MSISIFGIILKFVIVEGILIHFLKLHLKQYLKKKFPSLIILKKMIDNQFKISSVIGQGGSAKVFLGQDVSENKYAIKVIANKQNFSKNAAKAVLNHEFDILQQVSDHPNIIKPLFEPTEGSVRVGNKTEGINYNVLEFAENGAISEFVRKCGHFEEELVPLFMAQICHAVNHIHSKGVAHLDLKLENILLDSMFNIKVCDFGSALNVADQKGSVSKQRGTTVYMAPEVASFKSGDSYNGFAADVYSLGVSLFLMLVGEFPTSVIGQGSVDTIDTECKEQELEYQLESSVTQQRRDLLSEGAKDLINQMTQADFTKRPSLEQVLAHPWIQSGMNSEILPLVYDEMTSRKEHMTSF